jgi:hypothetical protein
LTHEAATHDDLQSLDELGKLEPKNPKKQPTKQKRKK